MYDNDLTVMTRPTKSNNKYSTNDACTNLITTLINISSSIVIYSQHRQKSIRCTICLERKKYDNKVYLIDWGAERNIEITLRYYNLFKYAIIFQVLTVLILKVELFILQTNQ